MLKIAQTALDAIHRHAEESFPDECCGCLSAPAGDGVIDGAHPCSNIQNQLHEKDPEQHPRTARDAYHINELELMKVQQGADDQGRLLLGIYHSHPDEESYFSAEDKRRALWDDEPMWPDAHWLIASVKNGKTAYVKSFTWDPARKDFVEEPVEVVPG